MKSVFSQRMAKFLLATVITTGITISAVSAWNGLTASSGDVLDAAKWNELVNTVQSGIPSGAVMSFNLASCPTGWSAYSAAAGKTVVGVGGGHNLGDTGGSEGVSVTVAIPATLTGGMIGATNIPTNGIFTVPGVPGAKIYTTVASDTSLLPFKTGNGMNVDSNMQPYVTLLYCQKN